MIELTMLFICLQGKTLTAICVALLLHRSMAIRKRFNKLEEPDNSTVKSSGIFLIICPKACIYDAWMRGLERFTDMGHKVFHYEGLKRNVRLKHTLESIYKYNVNDLVKGKFRQKSNRLLFIITTSQTASRDCFVNRQMSNIKKKSSNKINKEVATAGSGGTGASKVNVKGDVEQEALLFKLPYTLVIFDEVHKAKKGPATDVMPARDGENIDENFW